MGYFSNGTENDMYQDDYCNRCIHQGNCAVMELHWLYNYDECNKKDSFLHVLIPRDTNGYNEQCKMFSDPSNVIKGEISGSCIYRSASEVSVPSLPDEKYLLTDKTILEAIYQTKFSDERLSEWYGNANGDALDELERGKRISIAQLAKLLEHLPELAREHGYVKK